MEETNELRKDYLLDEWAIISKNRSSRPFDHKQTFEKNLTKTKKVELDLNCPFCLGNEKQTPPEIFRTGSKIKWELRGFNNKFSAVQTKTEFKKERNGILEYGNAFGFHEVIVETNNHSKELSELTKEELTDLFTAYKERENELKRKKGVKHVLVIKNFGKECGASLAHNHSQLITFPFIPDKIKREKEKAEEYYEKNGKNVFMEIARIEKNSERKLFENNTFVAFTAFAPKYTYEIWVMPKKQFSNLEEMDSDTLKDLGEAMKFVLEKLRTNIGNPPYNYFLHELMESNPAYCFHVKIQPNVKKVYGGIEKGSGIILIEVSPEQAAEELRKQS
ncbi:MAG: galactose-1-phosphate uridylyltransferase [Candidatus Diapherotrites archaeon CG10_big_fil_rev_8_21_14_0_10_31_34]|nr:MAG: galactose-1-phosphate uridylyltransferase [Candidatus Diapherotrites archaeon CG10_big_fil_rev_8_21_14_0_10_31_34]